MGIWLAPILSQPRRTARPLLAEADGELVTESLVGKAKDLVGYWLHLQQRLSSVLRQDSSKTLVTDVREVQIQTTKGGAGGRAASCRGAASVAVARPPRPRQPVGLDDNRGRAAVG